MDMKDWQKIGTYHEYGNNYAVFMRAQLIRIGKQKPFFSTVICTKRARKDGNIDKRFKHFTHYGGWLKLLLHVEPSLSDLVSLNLCDIDGTPTQALDNGFYYYQHAETYSDDVIAHHFRIPLADVPALRAMSKAELSAWIETQRPRWKAEADAVISKYNLQIVNE